MLVLSRKRDERIYIGDDIIVSIVDISAEAVRIGIEAPRGVNIRREEILRAIAEETRSAARASGDEEAILSALPPTPRR